MRRAEQTSTLRNNLEDGVVDEPNRTNLDRRREVVGGQRLTRDPQQRLVALFRYGHQPARALGRKALAAPLAALADVGDSVVEAVLAVLPELVGVREDPEAAPVRR